MSQKQVRLKMILKEPYLKQLVKGKRVGEHDFFGAYRFIVDIGGKSYGVYDLNFNV